MLGSIPTYQFLQWVEVSGRLEAGARVFSSSGWRFSDCRRPMGVLIVPATGGIRTVGVLAAGGFLQRVGDLGRCDTPIWGLEETVVF